MNRKQLTKVLSVVKFTAFVVLLLLAALSFSTLLPLKTPVKPYIVLTGSMTPTIPPGAIAFVMRTSDELKIGDVITFIKPDDLKENVTHRITSVEDIDGKITYRTKGDANNASDLWKVPSGFVRGKVLFSIPFLGFAVNFAKTRTGVMALIVFPLVLIALDELRVIVKEIRKMRGKKEKPAVHAKAGRAGKGKKKSVSKKSKKGAAAAALVLICLAATSDKTLAYFNDAITASDQQVLTDWWVVPTVSLSNPNDGQLLYHNNSYSIVWSATADDPAATVTVDLSYSTDGGVTYPNTIATGEANDGVYSWTVPTVFSSNVRVKATATDSHGLSSSDDSDANLTIASPIVMNEFLPNPAGADDAAKPAGEWVELYNNGSVAVDVNGWALYDVADSNDLVVSTGNSDNNGNTADAGETVVNPGGYLVVYRDGDANFELNNAGGDSVRLYNAPIGSGALVDSYSYTLPSPVPDNKSFARIPDGTGAWVDPDPTPGKPNMSISTYISILSGYDTAAPEQQPEASPTPQTELPPVALAKAPETEASPTPTASIVPSETPNASSSAEPEITVTPTPTPSADSPRVEASGPTVEPTNPPTGGSIPEPTLVPTAVPSSEPTSAPTGAPEQQ